MIDANMGRGLKVMGEAEATAVADRIRPRPTGAVAVPDVEAAAQALHDCYRERNERRYATASQRRRHVAFQRAKIVLRAAGVLK